MTTENYLLWYRLIQLVNRHWPSQSLSISECLGAEIANMDERAERRYLSLVYFALQSL